VSNRYLDIIRKLKARDISDISDESPPEPDFGRLHRLCRPLSELERRCPDHVDLGDWRLAVEDSRRFLAKWGTQAEALGWTARNLFGLAPVPDKPAGNYRRLSRYELTGLLWLLRGRPVVALTERTAAIQGSTDAVIVYSKHNRRDDLGGG
jgi:hypothetical protein